jgi:WD40 repeat protein
LVYVFTDDQNQNGQIDAGDDFVLSEFVVKTNAITTNTFARTSIGSVVGPGSYGLAVANYLNNGTDVVFTASPDGTLFDWTPTNNTGPLVRQMFTADYVGKAWHSLAALNLVAGGQGLLGLMVDPTNQNTCNVIFWQPQTTLPIPQSDLLETAPAAAVIPSSSPLGPMAALTVRLWDAEGNASTPFLQYQTNGTTNWQNATVTTLDGTNYSPALRVSALPTGANHTLVWNTLADFGSISTNILVRARAMDFMLLGDWSLSVPYQVNTLPPFQIASGSTNMQMTTNGFQFQISGLNGTGPVIIYASTNLVDWLPILTNPAFIGTEPFTDPAATNLPRRFYKATEQ